MIHVHPMDHGVKNRLMLHAEFKVAGNYRMWIQFIDAGELKTIPIAVTVK